MSKIFVFMVLCACFSGIILGQEQHLQTEEDPDCVTYDEDVDPHGELQRSQRSFLKKSLLLCKGKGGGLFGNHHQGHHGHYQGHQGNYQYGHYHGPSGYGEGGYRGGYGGGGYGGNYGHAYGGGYGDGYNSRPSYTGNGLYKPGLSYSIGGYNKSPGYGPPSYPNYGGNNYNPGYNSGYNSGYSSGYGYGPKPSYPSNDYSKNKYSSYSSDSYSSEKNKYSTSDYSHIFGSKTSEKDGEKSTYKALISKLKKHGYTDASYNQESKDHREKKKSSGESSEESSEDSKSKHYKDSSKSEKESKKENSTEYKIPFLPVVSQPVYYVPQLPAISVVQPVACGDINPVYAAPVSPTYGTSQYSAQTYYTTPTVPISAPVHVPSVIPSYSPPSANYISGSSGYQIVTPTQAASAALTYKPVIPSYGKEVSPSYQPAFPSAGYEAIVTPSKQISIPPYQASSSAYTTPPAPAYQSSAIAVPYNPSPAYSYAPYVAPAPVAAPSYPCGGGNCGSQPSYVPTYTLTSFDVQTITTPYQPIVTSDVTTFAKSGSSIAASNAPSGYVAKSIAIDPPNHSREGNSSEENKEKPKETETNIY